MSASTQPARHNGQTAIESAKSAILHLSDPFSRNQNAAETVRDVRYQAWNIILMEADISMAAFMAYKRRVEQIYGPRRQGGRP